MTTPKLASQPEDAAATIPGATRASRKRGTTVNRIARHCPGWSAAWQLTAGTSRPVTESLQRPGGRSSGPANHWGTT